MSVTPKVLLASSDQENRRTLELLVCECGFETTVCSTLDEARFVAQHGNVSLVFCDAQLPDGSYHELLLLAAAKNIPLVVAAHTVAIRSYFEAMELGALDYVVAPYRRREIDRLVFNVLRRPLERAESPSGLYRSAASG